MFPFRSSPESSATPAEAGVHRTSEILNEAILASSSSIRDSLPKEHHVHFETLRQEIIDFAQAHGIPRDTLSKPDALREAAKKLSIPDLKRLATLLERFEYLLVHKEPREGVSEALEHAERLYHLKEQYTSQVEFLEEVGILENRAIIGIDGKIYSVPTLEQIASRLFERRETLKTKHNQGFTKLLLVPFGMSLDVLIETLKQFLLKHKKDNPSFDLDTNDPFYTWSEYQGADMGDSPKLVYHPQSFTEEWHGGKTKMEILKTNYKLPKLTPTQTSSPGWTIHLLQPSDPSDSDSLGFAPIPPQGQGGTPQGDLTPRPPLEAGQSPIEYLSLLQVSKDNEDSPYSQESGMTPEDWIIAFMIHLSETGKPLDNWKNNTESYSYLTGAFFRSSVSVPGAFWGRSNRHAILRVDDPRGQVGEFGVRFSVIV